MAQVGFKIVFQIALIFYFVYVSISEPLGLHFGRLLDLKIESKMAVKMDFAKPRKTLEKQMVFHCFWGPAGPEIDRKSMPTELQDEVFEQVFS